MKAQKRVCLLAAACGLAVSVAHAQIAIVSNVSGTFTDLSGGSPVVTGDDQAAGVTVSAAASNAFFPAGTLSVCTNGHAGYGFDTEYLNGQLPNGTFYGGGAAAAVLWDDLITVQAAAGVYAQEVVENGVTVLVVEWVRMDHYAGSPDNATFELKIYGGGTATTGTGPGGAFAQYIYSHVLFGDGISDNGASATIGFQYSGSAAEMFSYNTASIQDGSVLSLVHGTTGACCLQVGCAEVSQNSCINQGGTYHGDGSSCAQAGCPLAWTEQGDAGDLPATAQVVTGSGSLPGIRGSISGANDCDMYQIQICDAANFSANTGDITATTFTDSQLFLFDATGHGVTSDDDDPQGTLGLHSRLSGQFVPGNGLYYLAVTGYNQDPHGDQTAGLIWASTPFNVERRPDGPSAGEVVASWDAGSAYTGSYTIALTGTCFISSPCYANCDSSTSPPILNIGDFVCFQSAFAAGSSYANCDGSTAPPVLNIGDFVCFQSAFAAGCQ